MVFHGFLHDVLRENDLTWFLRKKWNTPKSDNVRVWVGEICWLNTKICGSFFQNHLKLLKLARAGAEGPLILWKPLWETSQTTKIWVSGSGRPTNFVKASLKNISNYYKLWSEDWKWGQRVRIESGSGGIMWLRSLLGITESPFTYQGAGAEKLVLEKMLVERSKGEENGSIFYMLIWEKKFVRNLENSSLIV